MSDPTIPVSRSSAPFRHRSGISPPLRAVRPEFDSGRLMIHEEPLRRGQLNPGLLRDGDGDPPPDRGAADEFPPPQVADDGGPGRGDQR